MDTRTGQGLLSLRTLSHKLYRKRNVPLNPFIAERCIVSLGFVIRERVEMAVARSLKPSAASVVDLLATCTTMAINVLRGVRSW